MNAIDQMMAAIQARDTWEGLYSALSSIAFVPSVCDERQRFVDAIRTIWSHNNVLQEKPCQPLPGRIVIKGGIKYYIHGVVHDSPYVSIGDDFKGMVALQLQGYEVICEDGFLQWLSNAHSFNEARSLGIRPSILAGLKLMLKEKKPQNKLHAIVTDLSDISGLLGVRKELFKSYLPEPLGMRSSRYLKGSRIDGGHFSLEGLSRRYAFEAKEAQEYAKENTIPELHILVGCAHELALEYLISQDIKKGECEG
ncbi:MAG: hypothetical protein ABIJ21_05780 [Nanoarchaeota archaeon]